MARYVIETFGSFSMSKKQILQKVNFGEGIDQIKISINRNRDVYILASHFGNWEIITSILPLYFDVDVIGIYKPLSNKLMDSYVRAKRARFGLILVPMSQIIKYLKNSGTPKIIVLISDQSPAIEKGGKWVDFLGEETYFYNSIPRLTRHSKADVYYQKVTPKECDYCVSYKLITGDKLMDHYSSNLEKDIRENPEYWLWSHKRWKINDRRDIQK